MIAALSCSRKKPSGNTSITNLSQKKVKKRKNGDTF